MTKFSYNSNCDLDFSPIMLKRKIIQLTFVSNYIKINPKIKALF